MNITSDVQEKLWAATGVSRISDIPGFPLPNHDALKATVATGEVQLGIEYAAAREFAQITKSPSAELLIITLSLVQPALAVGSLVLPFVTNNWWTIGGAISSFLGQLFANPYNPAKWLGRLLVAAALLHLVVDQSIVHGTTWISFSFAVSAIVLWLLNGLAWSWAHEAVLASEAFAAYLFKTRNLHIRDKHGIIHSVLREGQP